MSLVSGAVDGGTVPGFQGTTAPGFWGTVSLVSGAGFCFLTAPKGAPLHCRKISRWWLAPVAKFGQAPMRCLALSSDPQMAGAVHDDKAEVLKLMKPSGNLVFV